MRKSNLVWLKGKAFKEIRINETRKILKDYLDKLNEIEIEIDVICDERNNSKERIEQGYLTIDIIERRKDASDN